MRVKPRSRQMHTVEQMIRDEPRFTSCDPDRIHRLIADGIRPSEVARQLGISRTSVWRLTRSAAAAANEASDIGS